MNRFVRDFLDDYSDESLPEEIRRVASILPGPFLSIEQFDRSSRVSASTVRRRFGGWRNALAKAGLAHLYGGRTVSGKMKSQAARRMTNQGLLEEMRRVHALLGKDALTAEDFNRHTQFNAAVVARRFGSWRQALAEAGIPQSQFATKGWKEEDCFENLASVWAHIGRRPKYSEMDSTPSKIPVRAYEQRWGSWRNALGAFLAWADEARGGETTLENLQSLCQDCNLGKGSATM